MLLYQPLFEATFFLLFVMVVFLYLLHAGKKLVITAIHTRNGVDQILLRAKTAEELVKLKKKKVIELSRELSEEQKLTRDLQRQLSEAITAPKLPEWDVTLQNDRPHMKWGGIRHVSVFADSEFTARNQIQENYPRKDGFIIRSIVPKRGSRRF